MKGKDVESMIHPREMVFAQDNLDIAQRVMADHGATKLKTVRVVVGEGTAVVTESLTLCFEILTKEFAPNGVKLTIEHIPWAGRCRLCCTAFFLLEAGFACPDCGSTNVVAISGNEFIVKEIEVE